MHKVYSTRMSLHGPRGKMKDEKAHARRFWTVYIYIYIYIYSVSLTLLIDIGQPARCFYFLIYSFLYNTAWTQVDGADNYLSSTIIYKTRRPTYICK